MAGPSEQLLQEPVPLWTGENLLPGLLQTVPLAVVGIDREARVTLWNPAAERMFGWTAAECLGKPLPIIPAAEQETFRRLIDAELAGEHRVGLELHRQRKDGTVIDVLIWTTPIRNADGQVIGLVGIFADISERKQSEQALREGQERFRGFFDAAFEGIVMHDQGIIVDANLAFASLFGYSLAEVIGMQALDFTAPESRELVQQRIATAYDKPYEMLGLRRDGSTFPIEVCGKQFPYRGRNVRVTSVRDLTERKRAETALQESYQLLRDVMEGTNDGIYVKDPAGRYTMVNSAFARLVGQSVEEVLGRSAADFFDAESAGRIRERDRQIMAGGETRTHEETATAAGVTRTYLTTKAPYRDPQGQPRGLIGISRDITERKRLEERLRHAQKMEAIGRLAGGVAHDFNNVLTAITGYSDLLFESLEAGDPRRTYADEITRAAERASALTRQLLAYSRQQMLAAQVLDLNAVVVNMEHMLRRLIGEDIELSIELDPGLRKVKADPGQLEQVILNLAVNARDAMPQGGRLTIRTANAELDEAYAWLHLDVQPGAYVCLTVMDTGTGMTEEVRSRLFEPFFTTKELGKGTGLGLSTLYGIVKQSEGHVEVASELGQGSTFKVYLPQVMEQAKQARQTMHMVARTQGTETVLLVEDDEAVRSLARTVLERNGYRVLEARHGQEAIDLIAQQPGPVQLLVSDVVMPHMNGNQVYQRLSQRYPGLKVLFISGYTEGAIDLLLVSDPRAAFLQKPFTPETFAQKVRELLDRNNS